MTEPADVPEILLRKAAGDESATRALVEVVGISDDILGFHIQQALEKRLKAVLASRAVEFPTSTT